LLSRCCSSYFRESSYRAPCVLAHFTLRSPPSPRTESASFPSTQAVPPPITPQNRVLVRPPAQIRGVSLRIWLDFGGIPDPVFVSQGLVHEEAGLIWRRGFSPAWPPSGRLRPASHVSSNPKLLAEQLCASRGAVWQVC